MCLRSLSTYIKNNNALKNNYKIKNKQAYNHLYVFFLPYMLIVITIKYIQHIIYVRMSETHTSVRHFCRPGINQHDIKI